VAACDPHAWIIEGGGKIVEAMRRLGSRGVEEARKRYWKGIGIEAFESTTGSQTSARKEL
jgi:hypothetical protein